MIRRLSPMEEKKATPDSKVGTRSFNEVIGSGVVCELTCKTHGGKWLLFLSRTVMKILNSVTPRVV